MAVRKLRTDAATRSKLGPDVMADLKAGLWALDCQSCGRPFGRWRAPALEVHAEDGGVAIAVLNHLRCRPPAWHDRPLEPPRPFLTWQAGTFLLAPGGVPVFLVNPSYEAALLRRDSGGPWRVASLTPFIELGLVQRFPSDPLPPVPALTAVIDGDRISVDVRHGPVRYAWHDIPVSATVRDTVRRWGEIMVAVTTSLDVRARLTHERVRQLMGAGMMALGPARLVSVSYPAALQRPVAADFESGLRTQVFALAAEAIRRRLGFTVDDACLTAALQVCDGESEPLRGLDGRAALAGAFLVSALYSTDSRDRSGNAVRGQGVHLITPDAATAGEYLAFFEPLVGELGGSVWRLGDDPLSARGARAYLADFVIGTAREFATARAAYADAGTGWERHGSRGRLAVVTDGDTDRPPVAELIRNYPRVVAG